VLIINSATYFLHQSPKNGEEKTTVAKEFTTQANCPSSIRIIGAI